jgi:hypothetical protein
MNRRNLLSKTFVCFKGLICCSTETWIPQVSHKSFIIVFHWKLFLCFSELFVCSTFYLKVSGALVRIQTLLHVCRNSLCVSDIIDVKLETSKWLRNKHSAFSRTSIISRTFDHLSGRFSDKIFVFTHTSSDIRSALNDTFGSVLHSKKGQMAQRWLGNGKNIRGKSLMESQTVLSIPKT